jgi:hypothetical protein
MFSNKTPLASLKTPHTEEQSHKERMKVTLRLCVKYFLSWEQEKTKRKFGALKTVKAV